MSVQQKNNHNYMKWFSPMKCNGNIPKRWVSSELSFIKRMNRIFLDNLIKSFLAIPNHRSSEECWLEFNDFFKMQSLENRTKVWSYFFKQAYKNIWTQLGIMLDGGKQLETGKGPYKRTQGKNFIKRHDIYTSGL